MNLRRCLALWLAFLSLGSAKAQTVGGVVEDAVTRERLAGASLELVGQARGTTANAYGHFAVVAAPQPGGAVRLRASLVGYRDTTITVRPPASGLVIRLVASDIASDTVQVVAVRSMATGPGVTRLTAADLARVPALMGEGDVLRALQLTPGVAAGTEGSTGLHVRGGSPDQNLILLDGAPVYNAGHLFGLFSLFPEDAIQSATLVRDGYPARYGGRLSSVLDVQMREGRRERLGVKARVGLIASTATVEGPILARRGSVLVSARRTYADLLARPFLPKDTGLGYHFVDGVAKANVDLSQRTRLFASLYGGQDDFVSASRETFEGTGTTETQRLALGWANRTATLRLAHTASPRVFVSALALYSRYAYDTGIAFSTSTPASGSTAARRERSEVDFGSALQDVGIRFDVNWAAAAGHAVEFGGGLTRHSYVPDRYRQLSERDGVAALDTTVTARLNTHDAFLYVEDAATLGRLHLRAGLHGAALFTLGRAFVSAQPRLSARVDLGAWSVSAAATAMQQPIHLLSNSGTDLPTDLWVPATPTTGVERAWQIGSGIAWRGSSLDVRVDVYAKRMRDVLAYVDGARLAASGADWESRVTRGTGQAMGVELFAERSIGRTTGWISYALSRSTRRFDLLNSGKAFPYRYDRTHNAALVLQRRMSARRQTALSWVYTTGAAVSVPEGTYSFGFRTFDLYSGRNNHRMGPTHRLDASYRIAYPRQWGRYELALGLYNVYAHMNPFYLQREEVSGTDPETGQPAVLIVYREHGIVPAVPFITFSLVR